MSGAGVILVLGVLGALLGWDALRLHRWSPALFRGQPVILRESVPLSRVPTTLPMPFVRCGLFYAASYHAIGPGEVAFTARVMNAPVLLGRLVADPNAGEIAMTARLYWTVHVMFLVGFALAGFPWVLLAMMAALFVVNIAFEIRQCRRVFSAVVREAAYQPAERNAT